MKIISCYIVGFGKFQNQQIDFQSNLLVLKQDNGWGKTTLADFIRCMFYGMDGGRTKAYHNIFRSYVTDCYFKVKLTEAKSGLSKTIKIRFDETVVAGVEMEENEVLF